MLIAFLNAFGGNATGPGTHSVSAAASEMPASNLTAADLQRLTDKNPDQNRSDKPKAYLNYVLFDDQFKLVDNNSGIRQVQSAPDQMQALSTGDIVMQKSGFLYIYTSNESSQDVFFDNLAVVHNSGPVVEETHYYPFGLTMAGISSNALVGTYYPKNRKEYNGIEHTTDLDLNQYDAFYRTLDPQIGRWNQIDPKIDDMEMWSPYASNYNNPISYNDFLGDEPDGDPPTGARGFWISTAGLINGINHTITFGLYDTPASAFGFDEEETARYEAMTKVGELIPVVIQPKPSPAKPTPIPLNFEPLPIPVSVPVVAPLPAVAPNKPVVKKKAGTFQELLDEIAADKAKQEAKAKKDAYDKAQKKKGQTRDGNSNQTVRGEHNSGGRNKGKHEKANKRRAREQKAADDKKK